MVQKIIQVGNSAAVTINQQYLDLIGLSTGDQVQTEFIPETRKIVISPVVKTKIAVSDKDLLKRLANLKKRYGRLYEKLAQTE
jgi:putative addiction module antidote